MTEIMVYCPVCDQERMAVHNAGLILCMYCLFTISRGKDDIGANRGNVPPKQ